ncbi:MAG TPA: biotin--[acetyl-CoA-carboxylase] ligase [Kofleriaceae bacterium]|nr:biotin--[acetyl-CoA-carboxylase] ligase [Kofleriaceae bacterium]
MPRLGHALVRLGEVDSTSDEAAALAARGAAHGTVVVAEAQRQGRGRQGRAWFSPPGDNLYLSCVLRPALPPVRVPPVTLAAGVAVAEAVATLGVQPRLKWPNDVLASGKKLAGVLTEMSTQGDRVEHVVLGVGVNVATTRFPEELAGVATSVALEVGRAVGVEDVLAVVLERLDFWLAQYFAGGMGEVAPAWTSWSGMGGAAVRVEVGGREVRGVARGIGADGVLEVVDEGGRVVRVTAGDVLLV